MVVRYCHGSECCCVELDLDDVQDERCVMHMTHTHTYSHISGDFQFPVFNLSGGCKMALEGRLKRVNVGTAERTAGFWGNEHV
jgi:hypothetical protein